MNIKAFRLLKILSLSNVIKRRMIKKITKFDTSEFIAESLPVLMATSFSLHFLSHY